MKEKGSRAWKVERLVSAGGVVVRNGPGGVEVVLCGRREPERWSLPKGTPDVGESLEETAIREVQEETGLKVAIEAPLGSITYWFVRPEDRCRCHKTVHFYLMAPQGGALDRHDPEFDVVRWFPTEEALRVITYPNEVKVVEKALTLPGTQSDNRP